MRSFKILVLILFLLIPLEGLAEQSGTLANAKVATGTDSASTNCCDIEGITFHIDITGVATVDLNCSIKSDGGLHITLFTTSASNAVLSTNAPCTNVQSDVTAITSGEVTIEYKVVQ